jgi:hypothetical protein
MNGFGAIGWLARMGFLVRGVLYMVVDALAMPRHNRPHRANANQSARSRK